MLAQLALAGVFGLLQAPAPDWPPSAGPPPAVRPAPVEDVLHRRWLERRRSLRIGLGVSGGLLGVSTVGLALFVAFPACGGDEVTVCEAVPVGAIVTGLAVAGSLISTVVYAVRLTIHNEQRPPARRVIVGAGGLLVRF